MTEKIEQEDGVTRKQLRSERKIPQKIRKLFHDFKENLPIKDIDKF
ncbi:hypothetical protein RV17_GL002326 [Enterococcus thailandicus]|nr:hypothetical protein [Enterococcus thailandicus]OJG94933.1 hypothetical protein RV17_GL002326 [Enterococcus thailandicus]